VPLGEGVPLEGIKEGYPFKKCYFAAVGPYNVKMVADRYRLVAYHKKHWC